MADVRCWSSGRRTTFVGLPPRCSEALQQFIAGRSVGWSVESGKSADRRTEVAQYPSTARAEVNVPLDPIPLADVEVAVKEVGHQRPDLLAFTTVAQERDSEVRRHTNRFDLAKHRRDSLILTGCPVGASASCSRFPGRVPQGGTEGPYGHDGAGS